MGKFQGSWLPESEADWALIQGLFQVTADAHEAGVPKEDIVVATAFAAMAIMEWGDSEGVDVPEPPANERVEDCPECGESISEVKPFLGGDVEVIPCGCYVTVHQVPGWIDG